MRLHLIGISILIPIIFSIFIASGPGDPLSG